MDDLRRIDLNLLLTLHALLAERHVSRAALRLHRSQPAVSHALAQLRGIFDDPLLVRRDGSLTLTARALDQLQGLLHAPAFDARGARRTFRVALSDYGSRVALPALTRRLRERAPGVDLASSQASREAMLTQLLDGEIDLALGVFHDLPGELQAQTLFNESFVCVADRATLPARGGLSLAEWLARPHVLVAMRPGPDNEIDQALAGIGHARRVAVTLPHWSIAPELIAGTDLPHGGGTLCRAIASRPAVAPLRCALPDPAVLLSGRVACTPGCRPRAPLVARAACRGVFRGPLRSRVALRP